MLAVLTVAIGSAALPALAQEMDVSVETRLRGAVSYSSFSHDASMADATLGDPTSVLEYGPLYSTSVELVARGSNGEGGWFDLVVGMPIASSGTFIDRDYRAGQALFQESFSDASISGVGDVRLRASLPPSVFAAAADAGWRPYVTMGGTFAKHSALGLRCTVGCGPDLGDDITVIDQQMLGLDAGLGLWSQHFLSERETLDVRAELTAGYLGITDSHYFRFADLGPVPNIFYDFATASLYGEVVYTLDATDTLDLTLGAFGAGRVGYGGATFNAVAGGQNGPFPAWHFDISAGVMAGASVAF